MYMIFGGGNRNWRVIYMDGRIRRRRKKSPRTFLGNAVGKWEGDTLVAESIGFNTRFWIQQRRPAAHRGAEAHRALHARVA